MFVLFRIQLVCRNDASVARGRASTNDGHIRITKFNHIQVESELIFLQGNLFLKFFFTGTVKFEAVKGVDGDIHVFSYNIRNNKVEHSEKLQ
jgi:hypothetical protein